MFGPGRPELKAAMLELLPDGETLEVKERFWVDEPFFRGLWRFTKPPSKPVQLEIRWRRETGAGDEAMGDDVLLEVPGGDEAQSEGWFRVNRPWDGWPEGTCRVEFHVEGRLAQTLRFEIASRASTAEVLLDAVLYTEVDENDHGVPTELVARDAPRVQAGWRYVKRLPPECIVSCAWIVVQPGPDAGVPPGYVIGETACRMGDFAPAGWDSGTFSFSRPTNSWPGGSYLARISVDGVIRCELPWRVE